MTMTGALLAASNGRNAWVTRTTPKTFVSHTARPMSAAVTSPGGLAAAADARIVDQDIEVAVRHWIRAAAACTESSLVTSIWTGRAPMRQSASLPRCSSREPR